MSLGNRVPMAWLTAGNGNRIDAGDGGGADVAITYAA